jgi:hypothetical protein
MSKAYRILSCDEAPAYRYRLNVSTGIGSPDEIAVIQLNPSTADDKRSDPTIGKVSCWARDHYFSHVTFINLFAIRATDPRELFGKTYDVLVGPRNDEVMSTVLTDVKTIVFAWGKLSGFILPHYQRRLTFLKKSIGDKSVYAVGLPVAKTFPRHGRMWNNPNRALRQFEW